MGKLVEASWAPSTKVSYTSYLKRWEKYCELHELDMYKATVTEGADFLSHLFDQGEKYGYIAGARSALSSVLPVVGGLTFGKQEVVSRLLRGVFKERPSFPKNIVTWDPHIVLEWMVKLGRNEDLLMEDLTGKLCTLLCLLSGQRAQIVPALDTRFMVAEVSRYVFDVRKILKTTKPSKHIPPLEFLAFPEEENLCIVRCLDEYLGRTDAMREIVCMVDEDEIDKDAGYKDAENKNEQSFPKPLILSHSSPYGPVSPATAARYVKLFLGDAGIDLTVFTAHSTRSASTSLGNNLGMTFADIAKSAGWRQESTFQRFYRKPIMRNLGDTIMKSFRK